MKLFVTGGAGFIGGNFVHYMVNQYPHYEIICFDALTYAGHLKTLKDVINKPNFTFIHGNILDKDHVNKVLREYKCDVIVNFAAESHVDRSIQNADLFLKTNVLGCHALLEVAKHHPIKRFHQVSTDEVYGDLPLDEKDLLFTEENLLKPSSPYSASKASADLLTLAYNRTYQVPITISRSSNNYGPYQYIEKLIPLMILKAVKNDFLPIYGNGLNIRDWLHVIDHCKAIDLILHQGKDGEIYNIGGGEERTNIEVVKTILSHLKKPTTLMMHVPDRLGHDLRYAIDYSKIKNELGWEPTHTFEDGMKETIKWYLTHKDWWKRD